ncbi:hypothetical protein TD95_001465 [Thielaviopsis punctulata]|uniref:ATP-dependent DNA helicase II subunit 1 n=1 Tax=Thielaviopsis punctulata TaxID=72032 RepID=A0A0F4ZI94_9PEZI|nr:hypothetical protein TD95_001465 [Thielaviopsis punctulata]
MMQHDDWQAKLDDDDDIELVDEINYKTQKDAIILAIDVSSSMLQLPPPSDSKRADKDSALMATLKCASHLMEQRIISNPGDMMGILFFGTHKSRYPEDGNQDHTRYPNCYVYMDLDVPAAEEVKALKEMIEDDEDKILVPSNNGPVSMANVLFCANQIFATRAPNFISRRLFILTDSDDPHPDDKKSAVAAAVRAKDLHDLGVVIELFPIIRGDTKFNTSKFYDDIIYRDFEAENNDSDVVASKSGDGLTLLKSLISNITSKQVSKRALFSNLPLEITPKLIITVSGYNVLHKQKPERRCYVWLGGEKPQIVKSQTSRYAMDTAETVSNEEMTRAYKLGGEYVHFKPQEQKELRNFGKPVIRILGFKPRSCIRPWESVGKSTFIYPSEAMYEGSTRVFVALWKKLLKDDKVGIVWAITRSNARPGLFALIPSKEEIEEATGLTYLPAGMWLYPIPFADDIRQAPEFPLKPPPPEQAVEEMTAVVENLWLPQKRYNPSKYPNPQLQWHYRILQAMALGEEIPEELEDLTIPRYKAMNRRAGGAISELNKEIQVDAKSRDDLGLSNKRQADTHGEPTSKKAKAPSDALDIKVSDQQLKEAVESGGIQKMTVNQLKDVLTMRGIAPHGRKAELIEKLEDWLEKK